MDLSEQKVAVVGGAGFIGLHVCRELVKRGAVIEILDSFMYQDSYIEARTICETKIVDSRAVDPVREAIDGHGLVLNLATVNVRESLIDPLRVAREVSEIGCAVPIAAVLARVKRYVYVSSSEIYGDTTDGPLHEGSLPRPQTTYGAAKLAGEHFAVWARMAHDLEVVVVRPFNAYGPGCHLSGSAAELIPRTIMSSRCNEPVQVRGSGHQTRDFTHVRDLARGIVEAAMSDDCVNTGPINLASGIERSVSDVVKCVAPEARVEHTDPRPGDLRRQVGNAARAHAILGWSPEISWEIGLRETIDDVLRRANSA